MTKGSSFYSFFRSFSCLCLSSSRQVFRARTNVFVSMGDPVVLAPSIHLIVDPIYIILATAQDYVSSA